MTEDEARVIFNKLDSFEGRLRAVEVRMAFGAGAIVAAQVIVAFAIKLWG